MIAKLGKEQKLPVRLLDEVYLTLEDDLWLGSFQQSGDGRAGMGISGSALSNPVVSNYLRNLEESGYFGNVELIVSQSREIGSQNVRDFQIRMNLTVPGEGSEETSE